MLFPRDGCVPILNEMHCLVIGPRYERQAHKADLLGYWQVLRENLLDENYGRYSNVCAGMVFGLLMALFIFYKAIYLFLAFFVLNLEADIVSAAETGAPIAAVTLRLIVSAAAFMIGLIPLKFSYDFFRFYTGRQINEMDAFITILSTGEEAQNAYGLFSCKPSADENIDALAPENMV